MPVSSRWKEKNDDPRFLYSGHSILIVRWNDSDTPFFLLP
jgi:hypothetical protein